MKILSNINKSLILIFLIALTACIEEVDPKGLVTDERKLVVNSLISPQDTLITVSVSLSDPIFGKKFDNQDPEADIVKDATVEISDGQSSVELSYVVERSRYELPASDFAIVEGQEYLLTVVGQGKTVTARATVPGLALPSSVDLRDGPDSRVVRVTWRDLAGTDNFYRVGANAIVVQDFGSGPFEDTYTLDFDTDIFNTDRNRDGQLLSAEGDAFIFGDLSQPINKVMVQLLTTDENFYQYYKTINEFVGDDPFVEPTRLISNVEGGLGIFSAYQLIEQEFEIN